jgi:hypothetical protein
MKRRKQYDSLRREPRLEVPLPAVGGGTFSCADVRPVSICRAAETVLGPLMANPKSETHITQPGYERRFVSLIMQNRSFGLIGLRTQQKPLISWINSRNRQNESPNVDLDSFWTGDNENELTRNIN